MPFLFVILISCKKEQNNTFECDIQGLENIDAKVGDTKILNLKIFKVQGLAEKVTLSLKNVPNGISYNFEFEASTPDYNTTLSISVGNIVKLGNHVITLEASSENFKKTIDFNLTVDDHVMMTMKVYDASKWTHDSPTGEIAIGATVHLYKDSLSFVNKTPYYTAATDSSGIANFYHLEAYQYLFTVEKDELSNIVLKKQIDNKLLGFATSNINKYGQLEYRDQNGDGKITEADRTPYDILIVYDNILSQRVVWIGY
jgi:hypothetical protein